MDEKVTRTDKIVVGICILTITLVFLTAILMAFTRLVLVKQLGMKNAFTDIVFAGNDVLNNGDEYADDDKANITIHIDWEALYPFEDTTGSVSTKTNNISRYKRWVASTEDRIGPYVGKYIIGYDEEVELAAAYDELIGWDIVSYTEYNGISTMPDGYLTEFKEEVNVDDMAASLISFDRFVKDQGAGFLYIQAPYKVSEYEDADISGYLDFSNQNANALIDRIEEAGIDVCDLRQAIYEEGLHNHSLFYRTDHHWLTTTGLWAAGEILNYCNENYDFSADTSILDIDRFNLVTYKDWFLGSQGKKVTLARTSPDDFTLLYPKYETLFHYVVPARGMDVMSDYSVCYDMDQIEEKDLYNYNPYGGCNYGDQPVLTIDNELICDDKKILIIHDSFGDCMISALALCEKRIDSLDIRHFTGSVEAYIKSASPDIVMVMYNAGGLKEDIEWETHEDSFDFR